MKLAFCLHKYFPFGGLQRDFLQIATACTKRGVQIRVYTMSWQGEIPTKFEVIFVPVKGFTNHSRNEHYHRWVMAHIKNNPVDKIIGFNKMPDLDVYYAADTCYAEKMQHLHNPFAKLTRRYKHYSAFEDAVFNTDSKTELLMLTERQIEAFKKQYHTPQARFHLLPPGISLNRKFNRHSNETRERFRQDNHIKLGTTLMLQIGSDFKRKGLNRSLSAIAALPTNLRQNLLFFVIGQDKPAPYLKMANSLGISDNVRFFTGQDNIPDFLFAADLLIHPAYSEAAGIVLLEAIVARLPVIVTDICGYAFHIKTSAAGVVIEEPFNQTALNETLYQALSDKNTLTQWSQNAFDYANNVDLYSLADKAADIIIGDNNND